MGQKTMALVFSKYKMVKKKKNMKHETETHFHHTLKKGLTEKTDSTCEHAHGRHILTK